MPPTATRRYVIAGAALIVGLFGGLGTWAALAPISGAIVSPGFLTVDTNRKAVQHLEGGMVAEIRVRDGDYVEAGDVLVVLDAAQTRARVTIGQGELDSLRARHARLSAESSGADEIMFDADLRARADAPAVAAILAGQREQFKERRDALWGRLDVLLERPVLLEDEIAGVEAQVAAKTRQIALITQELAGQRTLYDKGYVPLTRILELERRAAALEGEHGQHLAEIARARSAIGEAGLRMVEVENEFREAVVAELREIEAQIFDLEERLVAARDVLAHTDIRAPVSGYVVGLGLHTEGGVVAPGATMLHIVPDQDSLVVEARLNVQDIDQVAPGQAVDVQLSAFDARTMPSVAAEVAYVSADRLVDSTTGAAYYLARIRIPEAGLRALGDAVLVPGMPAEVYIKTEARTVLNVLLKPLADGVTRAIRTN